MVTEKLTAETSVEAQPKTAELSPSPVGGVSRTLPAIFAALSSSIAALSGIADALSGLAVFNLIVPVGLGVLLAVPGGILLAIRTRQRHERARFDPHSVPDPQLRMLIEDMDRQQSEFARILESGSLGAIRP
jgi:hypothetical protein